MNASSHPKAAVGKDSLVSFADAYPVRM